MSKFFKKLKDLFFPHKDNEFKPHFLRRESMLLVLFIVLVAELGFLVQVFVVFDNTKFLASVLPGVLTSLTNEQRVANDAPILKENEVLTRAAQMKANDMATKGYFAHTSPEGKTPWYWFEQVDYQYAYAGENLAVNFFDSGDVAKAWMNSPTHRANIVKKDYTEIGIGVATGVYEGRDSVFVAQLFGTPITNFISNEEKVTEKVTPAPTLAKNIQTTKATTTPTKKPVVATKPTAKTTASTKPTNTAQLAPVATKVLSEESTALSVSVQNQFKKLSIKPVFEKILTSPRESLTYMLELIALIIFLSIILVHVISYEKRHTLSMVRGLAVIAIIGSILFMNFNLSKQVATEIPTNNLEASIIQSGY